MELTAAILAERLQAEIRGDENFVVRDVQPIHAAEVDHLTFVADEKNYKKLATSKAGVVLIGRKLAGTVSLDTRARTFLVVDDAFSAFMKIITQVRPPMPRATFGVSERAFVSPTAVIGAGTNIYPGVYIGDNAVIGENCDIFSGVCIAEECRIGNNVTLYPNVVLYRGVVLGERVIIHAGSVIGKEGFGYKLVNGRHQRVPHVGTVIVENDVEIGACSSIDRAVVGATVIGEGSKLDNLVVIAHNCRIGKHNAFVSQVGLAGSVTTGDYVMCAGQVGIADHVHLGDGAIFGAKAGVHKSMPGGQHYLGAPAIPEAEAKRVVMAQLKLPELRTQVRKLEATVRKLEAQLAAQDGTKPSEAA